MPALKYSAILAVVIKWIEKDGMSVFGCHHDLQSLSVHVKKPPLFFFFLSIPRPVSVPLPVIRADLAQQVVDENGAAQEGLGVVQETQLL